MEIIQIISTVLIAIVGSGIIQWAFNRHDSRNDKFKEIGKKIDALNEAIENVNDRANKREAKAVRRHILDFADQVRSGYERSKESWDEHIDLCKWYEEFCEEQKSTFPNGKTAMAIEQSRELYKKLYSMEHES